MSFFRYLPRTFYSFGNEELPNYVQDISIFADIIDRVRQDVSFYQDYYIQEGERPDQVSFKLYETPNYHWTFHMMNDKLIESGWPSKTSDILTKVQTDYPGSIITTYNPLFSNGTPLFQIGSQIENIQQTKFGTIVGKDVNKGHIKFTQTSGTFAAGDVIRVIDTEDLITINSVVAEHLSTKYYKDANGNEVDLAIDDQTGGLTPPGASVVPITYLDYYLEQNDNLKLIKTIRPELIQQVVSLFREAVEV